MELFFLSFGALFSVINPLGTVPIFLGLTKEKHKSAVNATALWTAFNVFVILLIAFFAGKYLLSFFGISLNALKIAGGLIIASSGFALLTGNFTSHKGIKKREKDDAFKRSEVSLTPLAIPMLAGPGSISLLITFHQENTGISSQVIILGAIFTVCICTMALLMSSRLIVKALGSNGLNALSRIIGFIVIAIGVEYILSTLISILGGAIS